MRTSVTGEGALDQQSLAGKVPIVLASRALALKIPVVAVVGTCRLSKEEYINAGIAQVFALDQLDTRCAAEPESSLRLLTQIGSKIGYDF